MKHPDKKKLRKFGISLSIALTVISWVFYFKGKSLFLFLGPLAAIILLTALLFPRGLKYIKIVLEGLVKGLSNFLSGLILIVIFYLVFTPLGLLMRLFKKYPLDQKVSSEKYSYWRDFYPNTSNSEEQF
jgi:hypothetical protein